MPWKNPEDHQEELRAYRRAWYAKNADHAKSKAAQRRREGKAWLLERRKTLKCERCGEDHVATLDFHHRDPQEKDIEVATAAHQGWSIDRLEAEIAKCEVLCANCHRKLHFDLRNHASQANLVKAPA